MKVGILTFHRAINYGAVLQCWALQCFLQSKGHEVEIIDYENKELLQCYDVFCLKRFKSRDIGRMLRGFFAEIRCLTKRYARKKSFQSFVKKFLVLSNVNDVRKYDLIIIGSDQVWNVNLTHGFDNYYWGKIDKKNTCLLISYAASVEQLWKPEYDCFVKNLLRNFDAISVREQSVIPVISGLLNKTVFECVDPTLLLQEKEWDQLMDKSCEREPYLLLYQVRNSEKAYLIAKKIAVEKKLNLLCLSAKVDEKNSRNLYDCSPSKFVSLFKNASFVVCTSFHGTVFSVVFHKQFYSIKLGDGRDSRVENLLLKLNLLERMVDKLPLTEKKIDYDHVEKKLMDITAQSKSFLIKYVK